MSFTLDTIDNSVDSIDVYRIEIAFPAIGGSSSIGIQPVCISKTTGLVVRHYRPKYIHGSIVSDKEPLKWGSHQYNHVRHFNVKGHVTFDPLTEPSDQFYPANKWFWVRKKPDALKVQVGGWGTCAPEASSDARGNWFYARATSEGYTLYSASKVGGVWIENPPRTWTVVKLDHWEAGSWGTRIPYFMLRADNGDVTIARGTKLSTQQYTTAVSGLTDDIVTLANLCSFFGTSLPYISKPDWASATMEATNNFNTFDINNIEALKDLLDMKELTDLLPKKVSLGIKGLASIYLYWKYFLSTTASDIHEMWVNSGALDYFERNPNYKFHGAYSGNENGQKYTTNCTIAGSWAASSVIDAVGRKLQQTGLEVNMSNLWDLVPFSFVIDWICPIGRWLNYGDERLTQACNRYGLSIAHYSVKAVKAVTLPSQCHGSCELSYYERFSQKEFNMNNFTPGSPTIQKHLLEAGSIFCQLKL